MGIEIPVKATFDGSKVEQQLGQMKTQFNELGKAAASLGDVKFNPIDKATMQDMEQMTKRFEALLKAAPGLKDRLHESGNANKNWHEVDWQKAFPDDYQRKRYSQTLVNVLRENSATWASKEEQTPGRRTQDNQPATRRSHGMPGANIVNSAMDGAGLGGPGRVVTGSVGTGMAMGAGAGLAGLLGGLAALGIGKLASAATENLGVAEDDQVGYDQLKRAIGDVSVSFGHLKDTIRAGAEGMHVTWQEGQQLAGEFARLGNVTRDNYEELSGELTTGGGLSRALGLDPSSGVNTLGELRGIGATRDLEDSRRMALLIGETISRSGAFARADEVMEAISGYATAQTRQALNPANVQGYAGAFSGLSRSGAPGLDPTGVKSLLAQVNSTLTQGGAHGDASQFFSQSIGARYGLDPFQMQLWREGGAFSTLDGTFGPGSVGERAGIAGHRGDQTFLQTTLDALKSSSYANNPGMLAHATANHLGIGMGQATALLAMESDQLGGLNRRLSANNFDLMDLNASGITALAGVEYGTDADRRRIGQDMLSRQGDDALNTAERRQLHEALDGGDQEALRNILSQLVASRDQEETQGKNIRDTKVAIENLKTAVADRLVPLTQDIRAGILHMASGGKQSRSDFLSSIAENDAELRIQSRVKAFENSQTDFADTEWAQAYRERELSGEVIPPADEIERNRRMSEHNARKEQDWREARERIRAEERANLDAEIAGIREGEAAQREIRRRERELQEATTAPTTSQQFDAAGERGLRGGSSASLLPAGALDERQRATDALMSALYQQESGGQHRDSDGRLITSPAGARGIAQIMPDTARSPGYGVSPLQNWGQEESERFSRDYLDAMLREFGGDPAKALGAYNAGPGTVNNAVRRHGSEWLRHMPRETRQYVPGVLNRMQTPMPEDLTMSQPTREQRQFSLQAEPIEVLVRNEKGERVQPSQYINTRVSRAQPFGTRMG